MTMFEEIARSHAARYPLMEPQDYGKLAFQCTFGPEHMVTDEAAVTAGILAEWESLPPSVAPRDPEPIGNGLCRFHLTGGYDPVRDRAVAGQAVPAIRPGAPGHARSAAPPACESPGIAGSRHGRVVSGVPAAKLPARTPQRNIPQRVSSSLPRAACVPGSPIGGASAHLRIFPFAVMKAAGIQILL